MTPRINNTHSLLLAALFVCGCGSSEYIVNGDVTAVYRPSPSSYRDHSGVSGLPSIWIGKSVSELVDGLGKPDMILDSIPKDTGLPRGVCNYIYVYRPGSGTTDQCYVAYVIDALSEDVIAYYCR